MIVIKCQKHEHLLSALLEILLHSPKRYLIVIICYVTFERQVYSRQFPLNVQVLNLNSNIKYSISLTTCNCGAATNFIEIKVVNSSVTPCSLCYYTLSSFYTDKEYIYF